MDLPAVMAHVRTLRDRFVAGPIGTVDSLGERSLHGRPRLLDPTTLEVNGERIQAEAVIIATGTRPNLPEAWRFLGDRRNERSRSPEYAHLTRCRLRVSRKGSH